MKIKLGVFSDGQLSLDARNEVNSVLSKLALKYNCRFELNAEEEQGEMRAQAKGNFGTHFKKEATSRGNTFLSFGGELEIE